MDDFARSFLNRIRRDARRKSETVTLEALGRRRTFLACDWGSDTFVLEKDIWRARQDHDPVLIVRKSVLVPGAEGHVFCLTTGNHSVAAIPLLSGQFWNLGRVPPRNRSETMQRSVVCANVVNGKIEISQRDVPMSVIIDTDEWLRGLGWPLSGVVLADRVDATLEYYRRLGQEWRIKPLAWTHQEIELALRASRTRLHTTLHYYHNVKGVHFVTFPEFARLEEMARTHFTDFVACLTELVGVPVGAATSLMRTPKYYGHHEVELFGLREEQALDVLVPALEALLAGASQCAVSPSQAAAAMTGIVNHYRHALENAALADEHNPDFVVALYKHLTGEVYFGMPGQIIPAFDDRFTALPGATYRGGKPEVHPGSDARTLAILDYIESILSHCETLEYINVYELRSNDSVPLGRGHAREIIYKTNRRPLCLRLIEKRLAHAGTGYGSYMLARVQAFQSLGVAYGAHHLLSRHDGRAGEVHYYIRERYPGDPFGSIPRQRFLKVDEHGVAVEDPDVVLSIAALMGTAAAQNLAVKRFVPGVGSNYFGEGKEIIEFGFDVRRLREMPLRVRLCSVRGTLGWPHAAWTEENLQRCFEFYFTSFARCMIAYWKEHQHAVTLAQVGERFLDGFAQTTRELHWHYTCRREQFDLFDPDVRANFKFKPKWQFALWALVQQHKRLAVLRDLFGHRVRELLTVAAPEPPTASNQAPAGTA